MYIQISTPCIVLKKRECRGLSSSKSEWNSDRALNMHFSDEEINLLNWKYSNKVNLSYARKDHSVAKWPKENVQNIYNHFSKKKNIIKRSPVHLGIML